MLDWNGEKGIWAEVDRDGGQINEKREREAVARIVEAQVAELARARGERWGKKGSVHPEPPSDLPIGGPPIPPPGRSK